MKTLIIVIALFFYSSNILSQRILIPYRIVDKWGIANFFGKLIVDTIYDEVGLFSNSLAKVKLNNKYGYVNENGIEVIKPMYDSATDFNKGHARVSKEDKTFVIDTKNNIVNDTLYKELTLPASYYIVAPERNLTNLEKGQWEKLCFKLKCDKVYAIKDNEFGFIVEKDNKYGVVQYGSLWVPVKYDSVHYFGNESYVTYLNGKRGLCVRFRGGTPPIVKPAEYDSVKIIKRKNISGLLYWYKKDGLWGFIDSRENFTKPEFVKIDIPREREFLYKLSLPNGKWGYYVIGLDKKFFKEVIPPTLNELRTIFKEAEDYANNYINQKYGNNVKLIKLCFDKCVHNNSPFDKYKNFALNKGGYETDTLCMDKYTAILLKKNIIEPKYIFVSRILIETCEHLYSKFNDLIIKYPNYPFSQTVVAFKSDIVNEINPLLINEAMSNVIVNYDFNNEFYKKVILLYNFYSLCYARLINKKKLPNPFNK